MIKKIIVGLGLFLILGITGLLLGLSQLKPYTWHGSVFQPASPAFDISLNDVHNQPYHLAAAKGKITLLFFGYTHCPDECPLTLANLKQVKKDLGPLADKVDVVFVTVDPQRDAPAVVQAYLATFDPTFIGLTGSSSVLDPVWKAYGVYSQTDGGSILAGYQVVHSTQLYLIDQKGSLRLTYSTENTPADIEQDIRYLLKRG